MKKLSREALKNATITETGFCVNDINFEIDKTKTVNKGTSSRGLWSDFRSTDGEYFIRLYKKDLLTFGMNDLALHLFNK